jgi:diketogulonate reductase-like aldo/keto reductase
MTCLIITCTPPVNKVKDVKIMINAITDSTTLNNGVKMPWLGLGLWQVEKADVISSAIRAALDAGYTSFDTATAYGNEVEIGTAIKQTGVKREDLFITTKLWNPQQVKGYAASIQACKDSLSWLQLDYVDLYLIHWPVPAKKQYVNAWKALIQLRKEGLARAIGVSNFQIHHLEEIIRETGVIPAVNQVERHPWLNQQELIAWCRDKGIQVEAYSPLMRGHITEEKTLAELAARHHKTPAQIVLRWDLQSEVVCIPKSVHDHRIRENADIFDFELSAEDMAAIDGLNRNHRLLPDPDRMNYC